MSDIVSKKNKHLTLDERIEIEQCLNRKISFKGIGKLLGKDQTTISKEVKKHLEILDDGVTRIVSGSNPRDQNICPCLLKAPFVCNPCDKRHTRCKFRKQFYRAKTAQRDYEKLLKESREGIPLNKEEFYEYDRILSGKLKDGQHLYHIMKTYDLGRSKSSAYRDLHRGYISAEPLDFPRVVKFKARAPKRESYVPKAAKVGRTYEDFLTYVDENDVSTWVEMDTVIGRVGGKAIMTMDFTFCNFMPGFLLDSKSSAALSGKVAELKSSLAGIGVSFGDIIPLALTDNGGEFADVLTIENNADGEKEASLYFCDPYRSCQKSKVEKNHTLFRDIVPRGTSFDGFSQQTVNLIFSHVNGVKRKRFGGKSPYEIFVFMYGAAVAAALGIEYIPPDQVIQSPKLLKNLLSK